MSAEAIAELADHPNICGVKDSGGDIAKIGQILFLTEGKRFQVLAGSASFLYPAVSLGASGGVCALANVSNIIRKQFCQLIYLNFKVLGEEVVKLYKATTSGDHAAAAVLQKRLIGPNQAVTKQYGVPGLKVVMEEFGFQAGQLRAPLIDASSSDAESVKTIFKNSRYL